MKKTLTMAVATLIVGAVTASAAIVGATTLDSATQYAGNGTWSLDVTGPTQLLTANNWDVRMTGYVLPMGADVNMYVISMTGLHTVFTPDPGTKITLGVGLFNYAGSYGEANTTIPHTVGNDQWVLTANINPAGTMNWDVTGKHVVPEPGSFALIAGLGLVGFAAYRRTRA